MRHNYYAKYKNVELRPLSKQDIEFLRVWRNNSFQTQYLRKLKPITPEMQIKWFEEYLHNQDELIFAIVETEQLNRIVGSVALYDFQENTAEIGKIQIGDEMVHGKGLGKISLVMCMLIGFSKLRLSKIVGSVHQDNIPAHRNDMQVGFQIVGSHPAPMGGIEDEIEIDEARLLDVNCYASEIIIGERKEECK